MDSSPFGTRASLWAAEYSTLSVGTRRLHLFARLTPTTNHLRQQEHGLEDRPGSETAGESTKQFTGCLVVVKPPKVGNERHSIYVNVLRMDQFQQPGSPVGAAEPALLSATPRSLGNAVRIEDLINHNRAGIDARCHPLPAGDVVGPHAGRQAELAIVRQPHCLFLGSEIHDWQDWSERLFTHHVHFVIHVGEHGGWIKWSAPFTQALAAQERDRAVINGLVNVALDDEQLALARHRTDIHRLLRARRLVQSLGFLDYLGNKQLGNAFVYVTTFD